MSSRPRLRAGDAERERTAEVLRQAHVEGRLSLDEFGQRLDAAFEATYLDELGPLTADLPPTGSHLPDLARRTSGSQRTAAAWAAGRPGWPAPARPPGWPRPFLAVVVVLAVTASVVALAGGYPPWPLLWLAVVAAVVGGRRRHLAHVPSGAHPSRGCSRP